MFLEDLCIEYSKTNRATCGQCRGRIQFDELRIDEGLQIDEDEKPIMFWTHLSCFHVWRKYRDVDAILIKGYNELSSEHQRITKLIFEAGRIRHKFKILSQTRQEDQRQGREHHGCKNGQKSETGKENQQMNKNNKRVKASNTEHKSITKKTPKKDLVLQGYSYSQFEKYLNFLDSLEHMSTAQLRKMLQINSQSILGDKEALAHRCADGMLLGAISKCPTCKHQNMDFNFTDGFFECLGRQPGACGMKYGSDLITRTPWIKEDIQKQ